MDGPTLVGALALALGIRDRADPVPPAELVDDFEWSKVGSGDRVVSWTGERGELAISSNPVPAAEAVPDRVRDPDSAGSTQR
jgi:hypothetical protein